MRVLVHDFPGHWFATELSRYLAEAGHEVVHAHCAGVTSGRGPVTSRDGDPPGLRFVAVSNEPFERYSPVGRVRSELAYGRALAELLTTVQPDVILSSQTPLLAQRRLWRAARRAGAARVFWLQDFLGHFTHEVLRGKSRLLAATVGVTWERLERRLLRQADRIIVISSDFLDELERLGIDTPATVIENWTPIEEFPLVDKSNPWSRANSLDDVPVVLYSGTLGLKHSAELLVSLARALDGEPARRLVVVTEGLGREHLDAVDDPAVRRSLRTFDFVPWEQMPEVLGTADVCIVLLDPGAGAFSVPSKLLAYLVAGRPIVGSLPATNLAARTILDAGAGVVVASGNEQAFAQAVLDLLGDERRRSEMAANARRYAEDNFGIDRKGAAFLEVLQKANT